MLYITRREHFSASHTLHNKNLSKEENEVLFGKCNSFHGHNYYMEVTLAGEINPKSGYVMDLKKLNEILLDKVINIVDHKFLNDVGIFKSIIPTTENMAMVFWKELKDVLKADNHRLYSIKLYETEKNFVIYKGDE
ncbi:MAG: 6-carboxytetrahydropterin synthase [Ignavibacteriota bacterium]|nr:6-carboxytetrahydropterin synthase [Ignavibacteriota bacterium]